MTAPHHHGHDTAFMVASKGIRHTARRTWAGGKKHAVSIIYTTLVGVAVEVGPMLEKHWDAQDVSSHFSRIGNKFKQVDEHLTFTDNRVTALETTNAAREAYERGLQDAQAMKGHNP